MAKQQQESHEHGVGFLVHKDIVNTVIGCRPVSSRLITIRLRAVPLNITIVQVYAPMSDYDDNEIEEFYDQLQNVIDQTPMKDVLDENKQLYNTGSVAARVNKDRAFRHTPGRRCQVCHWCVINSESKPTSARYAGQA